VVRHSTGYILRDDQFKLIIGTPATSLKDIPMRDLLSPRFSENTPLGFSALRCGALVCASQSRRISHPTYPQKKKAEIYSSRRLLCTLWLKQPRGPPKKQKNTAKKAQFKYTLLISNDNKGKVLKKKKTRKK
jgi:hypothetical protein